MMSNATLENEKFDILIKTVADFSEQNHLHWRLKRKGATGLPFLVFEQLLHSKDEGGESSCFKVSQGPREDEKEFEYDQATLVTGGNDTINMEYHIVYSESYQVPVLYFNALHPDGKLLTLNEIWKSVPKLYQQRIEHDRWAVITQQEHPILGRPFFQLHPCHTADLMTQALNGTSKPKSNNYIITWLSSVGPLVGLRLPLMFSKLCGSGS